MLKNCVSLFSSSVNQTSHLFERIPNFQMMRKQFKHEMPKNLKDIPNAKNPEFGKMVQYYYHNAAQIMEESVIKEVAAKYPKMKKEQVTSRVSAILQLIGKTSCCLEVTFPLLRENGKYELITGYRSHHMRHKLPLKGGIVIKFLLQETQLLKFSFRRSAICNRRK